MIFKKKVIILCSIAAILLVSYILTFVLSSTERAARGAQWAPLTKGVTANADRIEIKSAGENSEGVSLSFVKVANDWFMQINDNNFPARSSRIDDMFSALTQKAPYIVHSNSASNYAKFNVADNAEKSITIKQGDVTLLQLYIGSAETSGNGIYVRKAGESAVRSGKDIFSAYTTAERNAWGDTRLFPNHDALGFSVDSVQMIRVIPPVPSGAVPLEPAEGGESPIKATLPYSIVRDGSAWKFEGAGSSEELNGSTVDEAIRFMLDSGGEDFVTEITAEDAAFSASNQGAGRVLLDTGDGKTYSVTLGPKINDKYTALTTQTATGGYVVSLNNWTVSRFWRDKNEYVASAK